jgi:hypothetical protein
MNFQPQRGLFGVFNGSHLCHSQVLQGNICWHRIDGVGSGFAALLGSDDVSLKQRKWEFVRESRWVRNVSALPDCREVFCDANEL